MSRHRQKKGPGAGAKAAVLAGAGLEPILFALFLTPKQRFDKIFVKIYNAP